MGHESTGLGVVPVHLLGIMGARSLIDRVSKADEIPSEGPTVVPRPYRAYQEDRPALPHAKGPSFSLDATPAPSGQLEGQHRHSHTHVPGSARSARFPTSGCFQSRWRDRYVWENVRDRVGAAFPIVSSVPLLSIRAPCRPSRQRQRLGEAQADLRAELHPSQAAQDLPAAGVGSPAGRHAYHPGSGRHRLPRPLVLRTARRGERR